MEPSIARAHSRRREIAEPQFESCLISSLTAGAIAGARHPSQPTGAPFTDPNAGPKEARHGALLGRLHPFVRSAACRMGLSSDKSATSCLRFRFSSSI